MLPAKTLRKGNHGEKKEDEKKTSTHTTASGKVVGGRGGSFGTSSTKATASKSTVSKTTSSKTATSQTTSKPSTSGKTSSSKTSSSQSVSSSQRPNSVPLPLSIEQTIQNRETIKKLAQAQRGLASYAADSQMKNTGYEFQVPSDAPLSVYGLAESRNSLNAYRKMNDDWSFNEKLSFGYLYDQSKREAEKYAIAVNSARGSKKTHESRNAARIRSSQNLKSGVLHSAAALGASALFSGPELLDRIVQFTTLGTTVERPFITPWDYSQEVKAGIRDVLNGVDEYGVPRKVLDDDIPILGGKGLGDLYEIGFGVAESWLTANTIGSAFLTGGRLAADAAMAANAFARTANAAIDSARRSGADGKQSMALGVTMGLLEAAGDTLSTDDLLSTAPKTSVKELLERLLKHSTVEGLSETVIEGLGQAAEYEIMGDFSVFAKRRSAYLNQGFSYDEASRKAIQDSIHDLGYTMLAASAAGALTGGIQTVGSSHMAALQDAKAAIKANEYSDSELFRTKREIKYLSQAYERFTPEGQKKLQSLEEKYAELLTRQKNTFAAIQQRKRIEEAIRCETRENGYEMPFSPELYRMALEMATPYGSSQDGVYSSDIPFDNNLIENGVYPSSDNAEFNIIDTNAYSAIEPKNTTLIEAKPGSKDNPIDVHLKYKKEWTAEQRAMADAKVKALSEAITAKSKSERANHHKLRSMYKKAHGLKKIPVGYDLDHIIDLQLGGLDDILNTQLIDRSVNRSLGAQIQHAIKDYEIGTYLGQFLIE